MKAWQIFRHALRQLTGNLKAAVSVSALPFALALISALILLGDILLLTPEQMQLGTSSGQAGSDFGRILLAAVIFTVAFFWTAVAWHRFVLLGEISGWRPPFHGRRMAAYFGKGLLIGLILVIPALMLMFFITMLAANLPAGLAPYTMLLVVPAYLLISTIGLRLATILPGVALGHQTSVIDGLTASDGNGLNFLGLVVILALASLATDFIAQFLAPISLGLMFVWCIPAQWFLAMLGLSILTTLYGHYIEKRPLI